MNILDAILLIIFIIAAIMGYRRGIIVQICGIAGLLLGVVAAYKFSNLLGDWLSVGETFTPVLNFIVVFIVVVLILFLIGRLFRGILRKTILGVIDRLGGLALGVVMMCLVMSLLLGMLKNINDRYDFMSPDIFSKSLLYGPLDTLAGMVFPYIMDTGAKLLDGINIPQQEEHQVDGNTGTPAHIKTTCRPQG